MRPPQIPWTWPVRNANARHSCRTGQAAQTAFAAVTCSSDLPDAETGKNNSGSIDWQAASIRQRPRVKSRTAFGRPLADQGVIREWIADSRMEIEQARLLTLKAAHMMDTVGNKVAQAEIAMIKVIAPKMLLAVIDRAIQAHGGGGVSADFGLAYAWARSRVMRIVDGPDEVHKRAIARVELRK